MLNNITNYIEEPNASTKTQKMLLGFLSGIDLLKDRRFFHTNIDSIMRHGMNAVIRVTISLTLIPPKREIDDHWRPHPMLVVDLSESNKSISGIVYLDRITLTVKDFAITDVEKALTNFNIFDDNDFSRIGLIVSHAEPIMINHYLPGSDTGQIIEGI